MDKLTITCSCGGESLAVEYEENFKLFDLSLWQRGFYPVTKLSWREKLRWIKQIILRGKPWNDCIILDANQAKELADFLNNHINKK